VRIIVREYLDEEGRSPYAQWFTGLNAVAAAKVTTAVYRLEQGNFSNVKGIGEGVFEYRVISARGIESISERTETGLSF
jgi:putative component of toxin-antitoxin plasmid stabilization module